MRYALSTSFNVDLWNRYAGRTYPTVARKWPARRVVVSEEPKKVRRLTGGSAEVLPLPDAYHAFAARYADNLSAEFRYSAVRFAPKVFALRTAARTLRGDVDWIVWLDADVQVTRAVGPEQVGEWLVGDVAHLPRRCQGYSETGFLALRVASGLVMDMVDRLAEVYASGEVWSYAQWHDAWVTSRLIEEYRGRGLDDRSLALRDASHVFPYSRLAGYLTHHKGKRKRIVR